MMHNMASNQQLYCLLPDHYLHKNKNMAHQPLKRKWTRPIDNSEKFQMAYMGLY